MNLRIVKTGINELFYHDNVRILGIEVHIPDQRYNSEQEEKASKTLHSLWLQLSVFRGDSCTNNSYTDKKHCESTSQWLQIFGVHLIGMYFPCESHHLFFAECLFSRNWLLPEKLKVIVHQFSWYYTKIIYFEILSSNSWLFSTNWVVPRANVMLSHKRDQQEAKITQQELQIITNYFANRK